MATVEMDPRPVLHAMTVAHERALQDVARATAARAPRRSGRYAASIGGEMDQDGRTGAIVADVAYAAALERGADVGRRRGPHMKGQHPLATAVEQVPSAYARRLREGLR